MSAPVNKTKLGLFVVLGFAALVAIAIGLGLDKMQKKTVPYWSYFNESVQGLDVGAPAKFRGVTIGHVAEIGIAPDHKTVEVKCELIVDDIERMGLVEKGRARGAKARFLVPPDLRAQLGTQGVTGVKYYSIDFFDPKTNPPPPLSFQPPPEYIPAAPSMMKNLEDTITKAMDRLPELVDATVAIMGRVDRIVAVLEREGITEKASKAIVHADEVLATLDKTLQKIDRQNIPEKTAKTIDDLQGAIGKMNKVLDRVDGEAGLLATAQKSIASFGEVGRNANGATHDLDDTLKEIRDAAEAIRTLADSLDRDPDMLLKGRAKGKSQ
ncbi:MAG TPA: MlaD family protein [Labilithrix sp.]|jgi:paraquat-inducible protein B